jgi:hypothetical protein
MAARSTEFRTFTESSVAKETASVRAWTSEPEASAPGVELALEKNHGKDGVEERGGEREEKKPHG